MTSQAQAESPLPGVRGLAFVGFPLHPAGKPGVARAEHLSAWKRANAVPAEVNSDTLADLALLKPIVKRLGARARLVVFPQADHSFHVPVHSGRTDAEVRGEIAEALVGWMDEVIRGSVASAGP